MVGDGSGLGLLVLIELVFYAVSALCLLVTIGFLISPRLREKIKDLHPTLVVLLPALGSYAGIAIFWLVVAAVEQGIQTARDNPTQDAPTSIIGIVFPAGSVTSYEHNSNGTKKIVAVRPRMPLMVGDMEISELRFSQFDQREVFLRLSRYQDIEEWPCATSDLVRFYSIDPNKELSPDNWTFMSCKLSSDFKLMGMPPRPWTVNKLLDGSGWQLMDDTLYEVDYSGFHLKNYFYAYLDTDRKPTMWSSVLGKDTLFGDIQYAGNVLVSCYGNELYVFEVDNRQASFNNRTSKEIEGCVLQDASGKILEEYKSCSDAHARAFGSTEKP